MGLFIMFKKGMILMVEEWKDIVIEKNGILYNFTGKYQVSNMGRVRSLNYNHTNEIQILIQRHSTRGYMRVGLNINNKQEVFSVHRLVATAFLPNPDNLPCVNHKDENKLNNHYTNLEWCTYEYNTNYGTATERRAEKLRGVPKSEEHKRKLRGKNVSEETKQKLSEASKKAWENPDSVFRSEEYKEKQSKRTTGDKNPRARAVICIETGQVFGTAKEVREYYGIKNRSAIGNCCKGRQKTAGGYHWMYYNDYLIEKLIVN